MPPCIHLISGPRNISTAMMYAFGCRTDVKAFDEPFYAYYLKHHCQVSHPDEAAIIAAMSDDPSTVWEEICQVNETVTVFIKDMAHHLVEMPLEWMAGCKNIFLIRDPARLIRSFSKVIPDMSIDDIGLKREYELMLYCMDNGFPFMVVDANQILSNPDKCISTLCQFCELTYTKDMLQWPEGPKSFDGVWAPYWYATVHKSTGFGEAYIGSVDIPKKYEILYQEAKKYYTYLFEQIT